MKILIEGERYSLDSLLEIFDDPKFFIQDGYFGTINCVGYYHSLLTKNVVYILPKVFIQEGKVFGFTPQDLFDSNLQISFKHDSNYNWIRQLLVYFYNSLAEFKKRYRSTIIIDSSQSFELNSNLGLNEYSYLDLVLTFTNFYKKNKNTILYRHIEFISNQAKKAKWEKTIRTSLPIIVSKKLPLYTEIRNNQKKVNDEEELLSYFFSILNHFKTEHDLPISFDKTYRIITGHNFEKLQRTGLSRLRKIKHRYFADTLKRMYQLCELYFSKTDLSSPKRKKEEFISVRNYNIVFEDMVDKLFTEDIYDNSVDSISIQKLKHNEDGKIIDHIFQYKSLIDTENIFYIGDSKYYKSNAEAGKLSTYKQFTYAKNVIQHNIDLFNRNQPYPNTRYRDETTEGYNISPNFFIYGHLYDENNFDTPELIKYSAPKTSYHFEGRLFDRDTLFVLQYKINFLFVLKSYTHSNSGRINQFRESAKEKFRHEFLEYFNDPSACHYRFYEKDFGDSLPEFVNTNFKILNGKAIKIQESTLLLALHEKDEINVELLNLLDDFTIKMLE
ncbi:MAG: hypothetical protein CFE23_04820 [Flavobacterium sp. BFFFF1]|uniref:hypothetical protein n=1 Tax=Flavobacterium sp. BFFFF1 TaxID=2015557 RepID=UPI000BC3CA7B|nr:hypothetical protein [Flavobacterium sp. BFFFF1]OYU81412.1 MAG: hypothetical protein CFE23_04820 [Flavobacterium sp. BFFFF1]